MRSSLLSLILAVAFAGTAVLPVRVAAQSSPPPNPDARQASSAANPQPSSPDAVADSTPPAASGTGGASIRPLAPDPNNERLRQQIQKTLGTVPSLLSSQLDVQVTDSQIELSGNVPTVRDKETARRVAQSYGNNRKVVDSKVQVQNPGPTSQKPGTKAVPR